MAWQVIRYSFLIVVLLFGQAGYASQLSGQVVSVSDGDTITVLDASKQQTKVRLAQIDAPEKDQAWGQRSKQNLSALVYGKPVTIEVETIDKYGRTVGRVVVNGQDANLLQVQAGMAWVYRQYAKEPAYFEAEDQAKANRVGLWSDANPMPPWEYRHGGKAKAPVATAAKPVKHAGRFSCDSVGSRCGDMSSCAEAEFALNECGMTKLDRDHDGVPCESLCR